MFRVESWGKFQGSSGHRRIHGVAESLKFFSEDCFGLILTVHESNFSRFVWNSLHELDQVRLIGVCRVPGKGVGLSANVVFLMIDFHAAFTFLAILNVASGGTSRLVADEDDIGVGAADEGSKIIHDPTAGAHAATCNHNRGLPRSFEILDGSPRLTTLIDLDEVAEYERLIVDGEDFACFFAPVSAHLLIDFSQLQGHRRIDDDVDSLEHIAAGLAPDIFDDLIEFEKDFLSTAQAEGGNQGDATILECFAEDGFESFDSGFPAFVQSIAVGALEDQDIGPFGAFGRIQDRCAAGSKVTAENDAFVPMIELHICRPKDMARWKKTELSIVLQRVPFAIRNWLDQFLDFFDHLGDDFFIAGNAEPDCVLEHDRQKTSGGRGAIDRLVEPRFQQVGKPTDVVDVHMGKYQRVDTVERKFDPRVRMESSIAALERSAIDEYGVRFRKMELVARAGDTILSTMMRDVHVRSRGKGCIG